MKKIHTLISGVFVTIICLGVVNKYCFSEIAHNARSKSDATRHSDTDRIVAQTKILRAGDHLAESGRYEEAVTKYKEALAEDLTAGFPAVLSEGSARSSIIRVLRVQGKYEEAMRDLQWHFDHSTVPGGGQLVDERFELEARIKARDMKSPEPIYQHIEYLKNKYKSQLPPSGGNYSGILASIIIRLFDFVGDQEHGIAFVEGFLQLYKNRGPGNPYQPANPYFQIKQAFEQDKDEGFKGCLDAKPGEACMGRATKALIQSDYFSW